MSPGVTRRGLLGYSAALPAVAALPASATAAHSRSAWDSAVRRFETAEALSEEYDRVRFEPAYRAYDEGKAEYPPLDLMLTDDETGGTYTLKLYHADVRHHAEARPDSVMGDHCARLLPAIEAVDAANKALCDRLDYDAICNESTRVGEVAWKARDELVLIPAPDLSALAYKFRLLARFDMLGEDFMNGEPQASFGSDVARLIGS